MQSSMQKSVPAAGELPRCLGILGGTLLYSLGMNLFVVPAGLYTGGIMGLSQLLRTLILHLTGWTPAIDIAGLINYAINIPMLLLAWKRLDHRVVLKTLLSVTGTTVFLSLIPRTDILSGDQLARCLIEGVLRIIIFLGYMIFVSKTPDMKRVFSYHGAEHKTIRCYEAELPLTVENIRPQTRLHPRCGTSFLFVVIIISILVSALFSSIFPISNTLLRMLSRLVMLPFIVAIAYEFNRLVGRHDNKLTRILTAPGMWFQYFTTNEPDDSMIEVAIRALELVKPEEEGADRW